MAERTTVTPLQLADVEAEGYCDPESGVCYLPGAQSDATETVTQRVDEGS